MRKYKIISKFRFCTCFFLMLMVMLMLICMILFTTVVNAKDNDETSLISVSIEEGDTIWRLANRYAEKNIDIRAYISKVIAINELETVNIKPGQILYFPQYEEY